MMMIIIIIIMIINIIIISSPPSSPLSSSASSSPPSSVCLSTGIQDISKRSDLASVLIKVKEKFRLDLTGKIISSEDSECCSFCLCVSGCIVGEYYDDDDDDHDYANDDDDDDEGVDYYQDGDDGDNNIIFYSFNRRASRAVLHRPNP